MNGKTITELANDRIELIHERGDGLAQLLERWTGDSKVEGSNPVRSTRKTCSESKWLC